MGGNLLPHPAHSPDLAPSDCHLFGPVNDPLHGRNFADDNELKQSFLVVLLRSEEGILQHWHIVLLEVGSSELRLTQTLWKNNLIIAKYL
jgi:hypothetical protein